jgi:hypothetical protein
MVSIQPIKFVRFFHGRALGRRFGSSGAHDCEKSRGLGGACQANHRECMLPFSIPQQLCVKECRLGDR